jgi:hypothetical protein
MSQVGEFPGLHQMHRRTIRAAVNPMDKSTVVSIYPKSITEFKATIQPNTFTIPAGTFDKPSVLIVGPSSWWREVDEEQPLLEIPVSSIQIADSIVKDYANGLLGCNMMDQMPGIFYLPGEYTSVEIKEKHAPLLKSAQVKQKKWLLELVRMADIMWSRSQGNPLSVSDDARMACRELNIQNKPWLGDHQAAELVKCVACGSLRNALFPICQTCKAIADPELAKKLNLTFAQ